MFPVFLFYHVVNNTSPPPTPVPLHPISFIIPPVDFEPILKFFMFWTKVPPPYAPEPSVPVPMSVVKTPTQPQLNQSYLTKVEFYMESNNFQVII